MRYSCCRTQMPQTWDVFFSYRRHDLDRAEPLLAALSQAGVRVWHDETAVPEQESSGITQNRPVVITRKPASCRPATRTRLLYLSASSERLACSVGNSPTGGKVRNPVAWVASVEETKRMKPTDKAILGMVSESPGRNASEPRNGLDKIKSGSRAPYGRAKAA